MDIGENPNPPPEGFRRGPEAPQRELLSLGIEFPLRPENFFPERFQTLVSAELEQVGSAGLRLENRQRAGVRAQHSPVLFLCHTRYRQRITSCSDRR
jgi:hypothetical protein